MFDEYQGLVDKINNLKHHRLNHVLSVPQIAIVGDQSSGKSSVLEAVTKLLFPRDKGMCTRFATQVNLCREETLVEDTLSAYIDGEDAFNQRYKVIAADKFHSVIKEAVSLLCRTSDISEKVLELTLSGPTQSPLTIVDLPGFINTTLDGQDKNIPNAIRTINERYMKDSRTIILAVVPANVDLNNSYVLARAEEHDPKNERTVPIVTKPDMIDKGTLPELIDTILNNRKKMRLGYLVMRNTGFADMELPWEEARQAEDDFFGRDQAWRSVPKASRGRVSVKKFLGNLLFAHIKKELPLLKREVINKTEELRQELRGMGHAIASTHDARAKFSELTMKLQSSLSANLVGAYSQEYMIKFKDEADEFVDGLKTQKSLRFIRSSLQKLYQEYNAAMSKYNCEDLKTSDIVTTMSRFKGNELPGFVSFSIFRKLFGGTHSTWKTITKKHITNMQLYMCEAIKAYLVYEIEHQAVRGVFLDYYLTFYLRQEKLINATVEHIFEDEMTPFTFNKYYYDTILKVRADKGQGLIDKLPRAPTQNLGVHTVYVSNLKAPSTDANVNEQNAAEDLGDQLKAYCKVARKRIVDVVLMQTIERHMVRHIGLYFSDLIKVDDAKLACLIESEADQRRRKDLEDRVEILKRSLLEL